MGSNPAASNNALLANEQARFDIIAILGALSMFLAVIEYLIPKPIPFLRIGLANLPILIALRIFPFHQLILITALKTFGQALVNGTLASYVFLFSIAGSFSSLVIMFFFSRILRNAISLIGVSVMGALASNLAQSALAAIFIFGEQAWLIIPPLLIAGSISGTIVGGLGNHFWHRSQWIGKIKRCCQ